MTYISPHILVLDLEEDAHLLQTSPTDNPEEQKVNVTFIPIVNTDYDEKVELEL